MPLYEYQCRPHGHRFEVRHGITERPEIVCPECSATDVRRIIHPVGIVFKGSGFYATDSRASSTASKPAEKKESGDTAAKSDTKTETAKTEKKSDAGGEAKAG